MNKIFTACMLITALSACAAGVEKVESRPHSLDVVSEGRDAMAPATGPGALSKVALTVAAVDEAGSDLDVRACPVLARAPGAYTSASVADPVAGACGDTDGAGQTTFAVEGRSEVLFTIAPLAATGFPSYLSQAMTEDQAVDVSHTPLRLLPSARIDAAYTTARTAPVEGTAPVVVETDIDGGTYELLLYTTDQGPEPVYLDAKGEVAEGAKGSIEGGWVVFPNVPMGLHAVSFGDPQGRLERDPALGWASCQSGNTVVWAIPGYASLVAALRASKP